MMRKVKLTAAFVAGIFIFAGLAASAVAQTDEIEIILDCSRSMTDAIGNETKLEIAKRSMLALLADISPGTKVGFRAFGHNPVYGNIKQACADSELLVPIKPFDKQLITDRLLRLGAYGQTPIGYSLQLASRDFTPEAAKTIILISDGVETCGVDPVGVIEELKGRGIDILVHCVGFDVDTAAQAQLKNVASASGGSYVDARNAEDLKEKLKTVAEEANILLTPKRRSGGNILSAAAGTTIVYASTEQFAKMIDGKEERSEAMYPGQEAVFRFKDGKPVLLEKFAVPVFEQGSYNVGRLELSGSLDAADGIYYPIRTVNVKNRVFFGNVYQEFEIDPPAPVIFLKVVVGPGSGGGHSYQHEWKAYGRPISADEAAFYLKEYLAENIVNLISPKNGGKLVAAATMEFRKLTDGSGQNAGEWASIEKGAEGIFSFKDGMTGLVERIGVGITQASQYNPKIIEVYVSMEGPTEGFELVETIQPANMVFAENIFQETRFEEPFRAKYLKFKFVDAFGGYKIVVPEIQVWGTLVEE